MRFSHFLKYNAVPEWQSHYVDYNALKDLIYTLQTDELKLNHNNDDDDDDATGGSSSRFGKKLKNKLFHNNKSTITGKSTNNNVNSDGKLAVGDMIHEETFELSDIPHHQNDSSLSQQQNNKNNNNTHTTTPSKFSALKRVHGKLFDSRRSSSSSDDDKTIINTYDTFLNNLTVEKLKVDDFYKRTEAKFYERFEALIKDLEMEGISADTLSLNFFPEEANEIPSNSETNDLQDPISGSKTFNVLKTFGEQTQINNENELELDGTGNNNNENEDEDDEDDIDDYDYGEFDEAQDHTALLNYSQVNIKSQKNSLLKQSIINLYIDLCQLKSFIELNRLGFTKITKKGDKVLHLNIKDELIQTEEFYKDSYIFQRETMINLSVRITKLVEFYAIMTNQQSNIANCKKELKLLLHDHIVWERSNTWKDMLGLLSHKDITTDLNGVDPNAALTERLNLEYYYLPLPFTVKLKWVGSFSSIPIPKLFLTWKAFKIGFIITVTGILLGIKTFNDPVEHRCMALVECVAFLWASEAIPLHITAFLVPLLTVLFRVLKNDDGSVMKATTASSTIFSSMWSSTIMILLAGFTLAEALSQYNIAKVLASWLLAAAGTKPRNVLLMAMGVVFFLSMWISNVAAPVLTYSLLKPILDTMDASKPFAQSLILGVALAANIGGMSSPISSPQNIISMEYLKPYGIGWGQFFAVALPTGIISMLLAWGLICLTFKINTSKLTKFKPIKTRFTIKQYYVIIVTIGTILLWCVEAQIEGAFGSSGQIAILPIVLFFATGLLTTKDLNAFPWSIVILAMGGIALGKAVQSSGLLATIARALQRKIENDGTMAILCIFGILMLVVGTFVSHTVSAIIIIPLVQEVGDKLSNKKAAPVLVFGCTLLASAGMGLASAGFPNITAVSMLDNKGNRYLNSNTFLT
ncbi:SPX domain-containing inorganic phosphate transporter NDAI_0B00490 [Naumovozyma dairenensis CBS 421]|uniref:SPX domain-containing protein n=1 Tax=Naumovozyma dairenensis (strain ATCC 10597 / BCRC 20456 / CBS 421 / NBRC 0211 / NRRL Y-12639) TaxID=1071378 RepID=G0W5M2_NAUDC|nr:hypothetical protein NDAI_0B00490 [Naumovozyma dairenensis CBS 421]CCD23083.1 hypothetical protein NDAI_0B00490 [Naumovozyma dairenensis CBS 421]